MAINPFLSQGEVKGVVLHGHSAAIKAVCWANQEALVNYKTMQKL